MVLTARYARDVPTEDVAAAVEAAKALARADGHRVRTVSRVVALPGITRVELAVDDARDRSWVAEAREDALAWRARHIEGGGS